MQRVEFKVEGMSCMGCVKSVKDVLEGIKGVKNVVVDLKSGQTVVEYDTDLETALFKKAIEDAGFDVVK